MFQGETGLKKGVRDKSRRRRGEVVSHTGIFCTPPQTSTNLKRPHPDDLAPHKQMDKVIVTVFKEVLTQELHLRPKIFSFLS